MIANNEIVPLFLLLSLHHHHHRVTSDETWFCFDFENADKIKIALGVTHFRRYQICGMPCRARGVFNGFSFVNYVLLAAVLILL